MVTVFKDIIKYLTCTLELHQDDIINTNKTQLLHNRVILLDGSSNCCTYIELLPAFVGSPGLGFQNEAAPRS